MTIRDLMTYEQDIDVYSDAYDYDGWAICPPISLTAEGEKEWKDVLDMNVVIRSDGFFGLRALFNVGECDEKEEHRRTIRAISFLEAQAGYCSCEDWDKWFVLPD